MMPDGGFNFPLPPGPCDDAWSPPGMMGPCGKGMMSNHLQMQPNQMQQQQQERQPQQQQQQQPQQPMPMPKPARMENMLQMQKEMLQKAKQEQRQQQQRQQQQDQQWQQRHQQQQQLKQLQQHQQQQQQKQYQQQDQVPQQLGQNGLPNSQHHWTHALGMYADLQPQERDMAVKRGPSAGVNATHESMRKHRVAQRSSPAACDDSADESSWLGLRIEPVAFGSHGSLLSEEQSAKLKGIQEFLKTYSAPVPSFCKDRDAIDLKVSLRDDLDLKQPPVTPNDWERLKDFKRWIDGSVLKATAVEG